MKLIEMTDYVLNNIEKVGYGKCQVEFVATVKNYANFLKQPLNLGMFVPCDEYENVLEQTCIIINTSKCRDCACREYEKAKEKVLFKGFRYKITKYDVADLLHLGINKNYWILDNGENLIFERDFNKYKTIEDLVKYNLELTDNAIKQL